MKQEQSRRNLTDYSRYVFGFEPAVHHLEWIKLLEDESIRRLLIVAPPESAKSTYTSVIYPTWYLGRHPENACALVSCTATQAQEFGGSISRTIEYSPEYKAVFPGVKPDEDAGWAKDRIFIRRKNRARPDPTFQFTGVGGPIIGRRYNLAIVDDPTDQDIANSETQRNQQKLWFKQTLLSRVVRRGGRCIVILTRWHEDDLAAELMKPEMNFTVVHLPAFDLNQNSYWPEHWPVEALEEKRGEVGSFIFRCMYMGDPVDPEGQIIKRSWFQYFVQEPEVYTYKIQVWDTALKAKKQHDFSVCGTGMLDLWGNMYITDIFRQQMEAPELDKAIEMQYNKHKPHVVFVEDTAAGTSSMQRLLRDRNIPLRPITPTKNKILRLRNTAPYFERGEVSFKANQPWTDELEYELSGFPTSKYDDQVDVISGIVEELARSHIRLEVGEPDGTLAESIPNKEF